MLDAMRLMCDGGVSSVAVIEEEGGGLLSAVSVTDIGKVRLEPFFFLDLEAVVAGTEFCCQIVVPSQSNQILSTPLHQFIALIKVGGFVTTLHPALIELSLSGAGRLNRWCGQVSG